MSKSPLSARRRLFRVVSAAAVSASLLTALSLRAQNATNLFQIGTDLTNPAGWSLGRVPIVTDDAVFDATSPGGALTFSAGTANFGSLDYINAGFATTITNASTTTASTLTLGGPGSLGNGVTGTNTADLIYLAAGANTVLNLYGGTGASQKAFNVVLGQSGSFNVGAGATLNLGTTGTTGSSLALGGFNLTINGAGTVSIGSATAGSAITGAGSSISINNTGTTTFAGTNTFNGGVVLNAGSLNINNNAALGTGALTVAGGTTLNSNGKTITNALNLNGSFVYTGGGTLIQNTGAIALGSSLTITNTASTLTLNGAISDAGSGYGLTKTGVGTLVLGGANTYGGGTAVNQGTLTIAATGTLGSNTAANTVSLTGGATLNLGSATSLGSSQILSVASTTTAMSVLGVGYNGSPAFTQTSATPIVLAINTTGYTAITSEAALGNGNNFLGSVTGGTFAGTTLAPESDGVYRLGGGGGTLAFTNGVLTGANTLLIGNSLTNGSGTIALNGANSLSGATTVAFGTLNLTGTGAGLPNSAVTVNSTTATLALGSSTAQTGGTRAASVTLLGQGTLTATGNTTSNSVDTITGALTSSGAAGSYNVVTVVPSTKNEQLSVGSLARTDAGVTLIRGASLGVNTIASATAGTSNIVLGTAPTLTGGGGGAGSQTISIIPSVVGGTTATDNGSTFVTYDANGVRPLNVATEYAATLPDGTVTAQNVRLTASQTLTGATTVNSLILNPSSTTAVTLSGSTVTVTSGAVLLNTTGNNATTTIASNFDFGAAEGVIGFVNNRGSVISGAVSGTGGLTVYSFGGPGSTSLALNSTTNTYSGDTTILSRVSLGAANALPSGTRTGNVIVRANANLQLPTFVTTVTINGLSGEGTVAYGNTGAGMVLSLGDNNANGTFSGLVSQTGNQFGITKIGTGTETFSGVANTYRGPTVVNGGVLEAAFITNGGAAGSNVSTVNPSSIGTSNNAASNLVLNTGTLRYLGAATTTDRLFTVSGASGVTGTLDASGTGAINFTSTGNVAYGTAGTTGTAQTRTLNLTGTNTGLNTLAVTIANNGTATNGNSAVGLSKNGAGTWALTGTNTYGGATTVNAGVLLVNGTHTVPATSATGAYAVTGGTLGGGGSINAGANAINIGNGTTGGTITGGGVGSIGILTLTTTNPAGVVFNGASGSLATFSLDLAGAANDHLTIGGSLTLTGTFNHIAFTGTPTASSYNLINYTGTLTGAFTELPGDLPSGYSLVYNLGEIDLVAVVPEPSTWTATFLGLGLLGYSIRRRVVR